MESAKVELYDQRDFTGVIKKLPVKSPFYHVLHITAAHQLVNVIHTTHVLITDKKDYALNDIQAILAVLMETINVYQTINATTACQHLLWAAWLVFRVLL